MITVYHKIKFINYIKSVKFNSSIKKIFCKSSFEASNHSYYKITSV